MSEEEPPFDIQKSPAHEFAARTILGRFPQASLRTKEIGTGSIFEIYLDEKLLLILDKRGARYYFPSRRKRMIKWDTVTSTGLLRLIEFILRDLAQADYEVLSTTNKQILKRPIHISRYARCPECRTGGAIKIILRADSLSVENSQIYTPISRSIDINGAEIKCTACDWIGVRGDLLRKFRRGRNPEDHDQK